MQIVEELFIAEQNWDNVLRQIDELIEEELGIGDVCPILLDEGNLLWELVNWNLEHWHLYRTTIIETFRIKETHITGRQH